MRTGPAPSDPPSFRGKRQLRDDVATPRLSPLSPSLLDSPHGRPNLPARQTPRGHQGPKSAVDGVPARTPFGPRGRWWLRPESHALLERAPPPPVPRGGTGEPATSLHRRSQALDATGHLRQRHSSSGRLCPWSWGQRAVVTRTLCHLDSQASFPRCLSSAPAARGRASASSRAEDKRLISSVQGPAASAVEPRGARRSSGKGTRPRPERGPGPQEAPSPRHPAAAGSREDPSVALGAPRCLRPGGRDTALRSAIADAKFSTLSPLNLVLT